MNKLLVTTSILLSLSLPTFAGQAEIDAIEQAALTHNTAQLTQHAHNLYGYGQAFAQYQLAVVHSVKGEQEASLNSLDNAIKSLEKLVAQQPNDSEYLALLAQSYGLMAGYQPIKAAYYGPKATKTLADALLLDPQNPRAYLFKGISKYNTPAIFGGSKSAALTALDKAIELYQNDASIDKAWGHADAYIWRGLTYSALNNVELAKQDWQQALAIEPSHGWARMLLENK